MPREIETNQPQSTATAVVAAAVCIHLSQSAPPLSVVRADDADAAAAFG